MSRRGRAVGFAVAAALCAGLAASVAGGYRSDLAAQLGELRPAVVAARSLPARRPLAAGRIDRMLEVRRVPERFVPPGALTSPAQALGRSPVAPIPAGAYLLAAQLAVADRDRPKRPRLGHGLNPVELAVSAAAPLAERSPPVRLVDVVVTTEPSAGGDPGRTYVAAEAVRLLGLRPAGGDPDPAALPGAAGESWIATVALARDQALRLIRAESFARELRLIGRG
jgi:Flp pilus assembly protein CpaB